VRHDCFLKHGIGRRISFDNLRIVVVLETKVYVYNFADLSLIDQIDTIKNPHGL